MTENEIRDGMFSIVRSIMGQEALELSRETTGKVLSRILSDNGAALCLP
jgi:hypothetical protein